MANFGPKPTPVWIRLLRQVDTDSILGCWLWRGFVDPKNGYGKIRIGSMRDGTRVKALVHRVSYEEFVGVIPNGLELDHLCRVRRCCNPRHLEPVTHAENVARGEQAMRAHCRHGHAFDARNTYFARTGGRQCRMCAKIRARKRWALRRTQNLAMELRS